MHIEEIKSPLTINSGVDICIEYVGVFVKSFKYLILFSTYVKKVKD